MLTRDIIVVGASAGGVEALTALVRRLPANLPASVFVVQHVPSEHKSMLPRILGAVGKLPVSHPNDGEKFERQHIYVAPSDHHLLLEAGHNMRVVRGPRENGYRPAADTLFRSAARTYGPRVIGAVLTGALDDGTAGLIAIKQESGFAVVQSPDEAYCADMPRSAIQHADVDAVVTIAEMARKLPKWSRQGAPGKASRQPVLPLLERPAPFTCPACGGVLNEIHEGKLTRFRCRVGHAYNPEALQHAQALDLESALWAALRALEEQSELARRLANRARTIRQVKSAARYDERASAAEHQAGQVRKALRLGKPQ
jgi:two-component system, chemotaxis family, protein-glutamate methylesterase/glutaminase